MTVHMNLRFPIVILGSRKRRKLCWAQYHSNDLSQLCLRRYHEIDVDVHLSLQYKDILIQTFWPTLIILSLNLENTRFSPFLYSAKINFLKKVVKCVISIVSVVSRQKPTWSSDIFKGASVLLVGVCTSTVGNKASPSCVGPWSLWWNRSDQGYPGCLNEIIRIPQIPNSVTKT